MSTYSQTLGEWCVTTYVPPSEIPSYAPADETGTSGGREIKIAATIPEMRVFFGKCCLFGVKFQHVQFTIFIISTGFQMTLQSLLTVRLIPSVARVHQVLYISSQLGSKARAPLTPFPRAHKLDSRNITFRATIQLTVGVVM